MGLMAVADTVPIHVTDSGIDYLVWTIVLGLLALLGKLLHSFMRKVVDAVERIPERKWFVRVGRRMNRHERRITRLELKLGVDEEEDDDEHDEDDTDG